MTELEQWAESAARELRAIVREITRSDGHDRGAAELRELLDEYDDIRAGRPTWRARLAHAPHRDPVQIPAFLREVPSR